MYNKADTYLFLEAAVQLSSAWVTAWLAGTDEKAVATVLAEAYKAADPRAYLVQVIQANYAIADAVAAAIAQFTASHPEYWDRVDLTHPNRWAKESKQQLLYLVEAGHAAFVLATVAQVTTPRVSDLPLEYRSGHDDHGPTKVLMRGQTFTVMQDGDGNLAIMHRRTPVGAWYYVTTRSNKQRILADLTDANMSRVDVEQKLAYQLREATFGGCGIANKRLKFDNGYGVVLWAERTQAIIFRNDTGALYCATVSGQGVFRLPGIPGAAEDDDAALMTGAVSLVQQQLREHEAAERAAELPDFNWQPIFVSRDKSTMWIPIPREMATDVEGGCSCSYCKAHPELTPKRDTLCIALKPVRPEGEHVSVSHFPEVYKQEKWRKVP